MKKQKLAIGSDFAGYELKVQVVKYLEDKGYQVTDVGNHSDEDGLYAPNAKKVADLVAAKDCDLGILICGTGQGMAMAANRVKDVRAAVVYDVLPAVLSKEHNNANVLCTGAWMVTPEIAFKMIDVWLMVQYNGLYDEGFKLLESYREE